MELLLQPNVWSCLPTSFAMVIDKTPKDAFDYLGHDGSEILIPGFEDPVGRKGFHIQEMIAWCLSMHYYPVEVIAQPMTAYSEDRHSFYDNTKLLEEQLDKRNGVLIGFTEDQKYHAVAWDHESQLIFDPTGYRVPITTFAIESFFPIY